MTGDIFLAIHLQSTEKLIFLILLIRNKPELTYINRLRQMIYKLTLYPKLIPDINPVKFVMSSGKEINKRLILSSEDCSFYIKNDSYKLFAVVCSFSIRINIWCSWYWNSFANLMNQLNFPFLKKAKIFIKVNFLLGIFDFVDDIVQLFMYLIPSSQRFFGTKAVC